MTTDTLNILVIMDGKPGHENQSLGLIQAISQYHATNITKTAPIPHWEAIASLALKTAPKAWREIEQPDLIIGTGAGTQLSLIAAKHHFKCYTIVLSGPSFPEMLFDLCVIPEHDDRTLRENVEITQGVLNKVTPSTSSDTQRGLILIGGESKHYQWNTDSIISQIQILINQQPNLNWQISNSRRTPKDFENKIKMLGNRATFLPWESTPKDWLPKEISKAGQIWVTPDSVSMVYESLTSGNPVFLFNLTSLDTRVSTSIENLRLSQTGQIQNNKILPARNKQPLWEADRIARLVLERLNLEQ